MHYAIEGKFDGLIAVPLDEPYALTPRFSVWEERKHPWTVVLGDEVEHSD